MARVAQQAVVPVELLHPNPWNTNVVTPENEKRIEESIKRLGLFKPVTVRELTDGRLEILGGQHRWEAARRLGYKEVPDLQRRHDLRRSGTANWPRRQRPLR
jgi:ParB family chromosome partitioning protein